MPTRTSARERAQERELAYDIKFLLVVLLLFAFYPVGFILMWVWMPWPTWVKLLLSLPVLLFLFMIFVGMIFFASLWRSGWNNNYYGPMRNYPPMMRFYRGYYYGPMMQQPPVTGQPPATPTETPAPTATY